MEANIHPQRAGVELCPPPRERLGHALPGPLDHKVNDRRGAADRCRRGRGVVVVDGDDRARGHRDVGVGIDRPRQDVTAGRVDQLGAGRVQLAADREDRAAGHQHVGSEHRRGRHDLTTRDQPPVAHVSQRLSIFTT